MKKAKTLMVQGTTSDAGKSVLVAGLCRWLANKHTAVVPFKPQNMALNSAVTDDAGEIGRAQAVQAQACFLAPHTDMNPVLLKPSSDIGAQVIIHGKALSNMDARSYHDYKATAMQAVLASHQRLQGNYEVIVVEGAGSPAEINLRQGDIANMGFAEAVDCPVIIVADIDKGGVFAHLVGTLALLSESEQQRVIGFVINRFRGDIALLQPGLDWLEQKTAKPVIGVVPYLHDFFLDAEDAIESRQVEHDEQGKRPDARACLNVVVPVLSRISNHTDFDALRLRADVNLQFISVESVPPACDLIILPGSKNVRADMALLARNHWSEHINKHLRYGGKLLGICGGYQMLGQAIHDPEGIEQSAGSVDGFGLLAAVTELRQQKSLLKRKGRLTAKLASNTSDNPRAEGAIVEGYEIHCGHTHFTQPYQALMQFDEESSPTQSALIDGALSSDGQIAGTYLHGLFDKQEASDALLSWAGLANMQPALDLNAHREQQLERLAQSLQDNLDFSQCGPEWAQYFS